MPRNPARSRPAALRLKGGRLVRFPAVMGVLNVTPDSFSDGGLHLDADRAVAHALRMEAAGADIIDIGGESTRPGAGEIPVGVELARVIPVIRRLRGRLSVPISIDTRKAAVARAAIEEGASIVNDVSAMEYDPAMAATVARARVPIVLMHMRGTPESMMRLARYRAVVAEVRRYLAARACAAIGAGISPLRIILDPGIGFAKTSRHSLAILGALPRLCSLGYPLLVGVSRKSVVRAVAGPDPEQLSFGTAGAVALAVGAGASIVRVHEPGPMAAAVRMAAAITGRGSGR